ncbi:MAG: SRPBCC family protein [Flavobacteriales bacterium]|nr:SRPBCC family protein [Flavobacteriales bacterium]MBP9080421.1 SRPBCC family protein [Flavobacteriales bacterium]
MGTYGKIIAPNTIRFERVLPGPIERVWAYLTESEKRAKWLASGTMDLRVGGGAELHWLHTNLDTVKPDEPPEQYKNGHSMKATITKCEPPHLLGFTWGARADALSEVVIELSVHGKQVLLVLTHHRLPGRKDLLSVSGGWHVHLDVLVEHLNGRTARGFWAHIAVLNSDYGGRIPDEG